MIRISVETGEGFFQRLQVNGHSGMGAPGSDNLCAAVSVLTENLGAGLRTLLNADVRISSADGHYDLILTEGQHTEATDLLFAATILGLRGLAEQFPDRIEFITGD